MSTSYIDKLKIDFSDLEADSKVTSSQRDRIAEVKKDPDRALLLLGQVLVPLSHDYKSVLEVARQVIENRFIMECRTEQQQLEVKKICTKLLASDLIIEVWTDKYALFQLSPDIFARLNSAALLDDEERQSVRGRIDVRTAAIQTGIAQGVMRTLADEMAKIDAAWDVDSKE